MNPSSEPRLQLTPEFLNTLLGLPARPDRAQIVDIRQEEIRAAVQFNAVLVRIHLTYDRPGTGTPDSLIAKLPKEEVELYELERSRVFQPGTRENWFYRSGAANSPVLVPRCYFNETYPATGESVLLLEDLAPGRPGNWIKGATLEQAELALDSLAGFHAYWWGGGGRIEIQELTQLISDNWDEEQNLVQGLYDEAWPKFQAQRDVALPEDVLRFGEAIVNNMVQVDALADLGPKTLVHGDYRLDNILFGSKDGESACWVVDWEDVYFGSGMIDVSWFLGGCLPVESSQYEKDLLRGYHKALIAAGVTDYPWESCFEDYRRGMCSSYVQGILSATLDEEASNDNRQLAWVVADRFIAAAQRLGLAALMDPG